tara:strand:- start:506 stop:943 length:438 start_codon:yes stop_codon:yes gene_type:complete
MNVNNQISKNIINYSFTYFKVNNFCLIFAFFTGVILIPIPIAKSHELFLTCTGKFEINRGKLIKPDWETSYIKINNDGLISFVDDNGIQKEGKTFIRRNSYTITHRDDNHRIETKYRINRTYGTYIVDYPQRNRTLIGTCQKGRG